MTISKTISTIQKVGVSLSLGGSLSLPLAIVVASVAKTVAVAKTIPVAKTIAVVGISLCLGFRLSGSDGRKSENYELKRRRELKERKKVVGCFFTKEVMALTNFMLSAE